MSPGWRAFGLIRPGHLPRCVHAIGMCGESRAFTLIELLIVVAIIAILALIAVPNFLEAQVRAKHARVVSDLRTITAAVEAYFLDYNDYPRNRRSAGWSLSPDLTTPIAYLATAQMIDPFALYKESDPTVVEPYYGYHRVLDWDPEPFLDFEYWPPQESRDSTTYNYGALRKYGQWRLISIGPDRLYVPPDWRQYPIKQVYDMIDILYDPTNGTVSFGNIMRTQLSAEGKAREILR